MLKNDVIIDVETLICVIFRTSNLQHENLTLKQQLDSTQQLLADKSGDETKDRLATLMATLKAEHEKVHTHCGL